MAKVKYHYNPETLSYSRIQKKKGSVIWISFLFLLAFLLTSFLGFVVLINFFDSPKEKAMKRELENMKLNYELLAKKSEQHVHRLEELEDRDNTIYRQYFEAEPVSDEIRKAGFGGVNRYKSLEGFDNSTMIMNLTKNMDILSKRIVIQSKSLDDIVRMAENKEEMLASIPAIQPVKKEELTRMASGFGMRMHPILKIRRMHEGMDFTAKPGTPIYASGNGVIVRASRSPSFGNVVYIDHGYGYKTVYAHMKKFAKNTRKGKKVKRGDLIGYVGNTGRSSAPHLHYEVHRNGKPVNPIYYYYGDLSPKEFVEMQNVAEQEGQSLD
ncbi:MAG TPA: M23 family peptidase [Lutibacter sp.]|nr:M23 family peptidase [Lutibacter sp.]